MYFSLFEFSGMFIHTHMCRHTHTQTQIQVDTGTCVCVFMYVCVKSVTQTPPTEFVSLV